MSLVQARWVVPAAAGLVAAAVPAWLLSSDVPPPQSPPVLVLTELRALDAGGLEQARSAPIFSPDRAQPAPPPSPEQLAAASAAPAVLPFPTLVGVVSRARGRGVALVKSSSGQTVTLSPGESVDGWQLVGIGRDRATFASNGEKRVAALDFSNKAGGGGAPAPPPPAATPAPPPRLPAGSVQQPPFPPWPEPWLANQSGNSE
ncbi:MAG TPA: hypothetical protein VK472_02485 [Allosphingosinicella sp.]|nr:hypothetical protein [Allosphingosinicella sp.]